jgi:hypothetical protein
MYVGVRIVKKIKYSEWQSGEIVPKQPGVYARKLCGVRDEDFVRWGGKYWYRVYQSIPYKVVIRSDYQQTNGVEWQWRGII